MKLVIRLFFVFIVPIFALVLATNMFADTELGAVGTLGRASDPVIIPATDMLAFHGDEISELRVAVYNGTSWNPIPFQIDERNITGTLAIEDGILDANDELVLIAGDMGQQAAGTQWPADTEAQSNPRYALHTTDPLSADTAYAYIYRSNTMAFSPDSYVDWDFASQTLTNADYSAQFADDFVGLSNLEINGTGTDILDRQKIRADAGIIFLDEEVLTALITPTVNYPIVGPVRAVSGEGVLQTAAYGSRLDFLIEFDPSVLGSLNLDYLQTTLDLNDPMLTSIDLYCDSNGNCAQIDGIQEPVPNTPAITWYEVTGDEGGLVVAFPLIETGGGTIENLYFDDANGLPLDTGDGKSYGETGLRINDATTVLTFNLSAYILPPGTDSNVGQSYFDRATNPLESAVTEQSYVQPTGTPEPTNTPAPTATPITPTPTTIPPTPEPTPEPESNCLPDEAQDNGSIYRFCVPDGWEDTEDRALLVYAHGYRWAIEPVDIPEGHICIGDACLDQFANSLGFAFAATSYPKNGLAVLEGVEDMARLVETFEDQFGQAGTVIVAGPSEGGIVTTLAVEQYPHIFDGGLAACGPTKNWAEQIQYFGNGRVVFTYLFGDQLPMFPETLEIPESLLNDWYTNDLWETTIKPVVFAPENEQKLIDLLEVANIPYRVDDVATMELAVKDMLAYNIMATNEASQHLGGNPFDNMETVYSGSSDDSALNAGVVRFDADSAAEEEMLKYTTSGILYRPLVTIHTSHDQQVPKFHETGYIEKTLQTGYYSMHYAFPDNNKDLSVRPNPAFDNPNPLPVDTYGHCNFDFDQEIVPALLTLLAMVNDPPDLPPTDISVSAITGNTGSGKPLALVVGMGAMLVLGGSVLIRRKRIVNSQCR